VDFGLWNNRISGSIEYYHKNTKDLLLIVNVPQPALATTQLKNVGRLSGHGLELSIDALAVSRPGLTWRAGLVFSADRSKVTDLGCTTDSTNVKNCPFYDSGAISGPGQSNTNAERVMVCDPSAAGVCPGYALGTFYGPVFLDVDATGQQIFFCTAATPGCVNGRTTIRGGGPVSATDYRVIGNANPDFTLGFRSQVTWNRFDLSFLVHAAVGQDVFNNTGLIFATKNNALNGKGFLRAALSDPTDLHDPGVYSSRWIESGSFVRLQNITVAYDISVPWLMRSARSARVYVSADNLLLITGYSGLDPEVFSGTGLAVRGVDYLVYPHPRTITGGLRLNF
jgi:TonB-dependent starch-binding outer membrane protein SusC